MDLETGIVEFLRACYDEEAAELDHLTSGVLVQGYLRVHGDRLKADIEAKRRILDDMVPILNDLDDIAESEGQAARRPGHPGEHMTGGREPSAHLLRLLAKPYVDRPGYAALIEQAPRDRLPTERGHEEGDRAMTMCSGHDGVDIEQPEYGAPRVIAAAQSAAFTKRILAEADPALLRVEGDRIIVCGQAVYEVVDPEHVCGPAGEPTVLAKLVEVGIR